MKKTLLTTALVVGLLASGSAFAISTNLGNIKVNVNTPKINTTKTTKTTSASATKMKAQIDALNKQLTSVSANQQKAVNDLTNNLLSKTDLAKYKEKVAKLKNSKTGAELNIDIAEDGTVALNKTLKSPDITGTLKKLNANQKAAVKNDINILKNSAANYTKIASQATTLGSSISKDPATALSLHSELISVTKSAKEAAKQAKNITSLTSALTSAMAKAGIK